MIDRFKLEEDVSRILDVSDMIDDLMYIMYDREYPASVDDTMNMIIGIKSTLTARHDRLFDTMETLIKDGVITNKRTTEIQCKQKISKD
jgi:hypothetical protein